MRQLGHGTQVREPAAPHRVRKLRPGPDAGRHCQRERRRREPHRRGAPRPAAVGPGRGQQLPERPPGRQNGARDRRRHQGGTGRTPGPARRPDHRRRRGRPGDLGRRREGRLPDHPRAGEPVGGRHRGRRLGTHPRPVRGPGNQGDLIAPAVARRHRRRRAHLHRRRQPVVQRVGMLHDRLALS